MTVHTIYTDGSCDPNNKKGGWAFICEGYEEYGSQSNTTNNRMELISIINALEYILPKTHDDIVIISDSQYCIKGASNWMYSWFRNGKLNKPNLKNPEMWLKLYGIITQSKNKISFQWVKGHAGDKFNERADELANKGRNTV